MKLKYKQLSYKGDPVDAYSLQITLLVQDNAVNPIAGAFFDYDDALFNFELAKECGVSLQPLTISVTVLPNTLPSLYELIKRNL